MYQQSFTAVRISGNGSRPSLFGSSVQGTVGFHAPRNPHAWLGQTPEEWYTRAKAAVTKFDELLDRTARVASKQARDEIMAWVQTSGIVDSPAYRYAGVKSDLMDVERFTPPAVQDYKIERRQNRIEKLEAFNKEFETMVSAAETAHGKQAAAAPIGKEKVTARPGAQPTPAPPTDWTLPLIVGGGALAVAAIVALLSGGK